VIIVNWNVCELLRACLKSVLRSSTGLELEIIVVDSGSSDGSVAMLRDDFPAVRVIACDHNVGFSAGNNRGIAAARGEYLLCLNPDTEVIGEALELLMAFLQANPTVGVAGPRLLYPDGTTQPSRRRFPNLATAFLESTILQQWVPHNRVLERYYMTNQPDGVSQDVDWLMGACFMLRRAVVAQVGAFDEGFFMYSEELDWMKRIRAAGWRVVYLPEAQVIHSEGKSSEQVVPLRHIRFQSSKVRYFRKHHGLIAGGMVWAFLMATYVYQLVEEAAKWAIGHKRPLRRERIGAYWRVLRSGLRA
jgi:N-acetylglucosaminyl-diphospho-decaprenol L-rhamnosyltransferase